VEERPSFRRRKDVVRLVLAILAPWLLIAIAYAPALVFRELYRAGWRVEWAGHGPSIWFWLVSIAAMCSAMGMLLFGLWRLICYPAYRRSAYGWAWPFLMWLSICAWDLTVGH
jgi:hypothetical protein